MSIDRVGLLLTTGMVFGVVTMLWEPPKSGAVVLNG